jgi:hypothetical protein
VPRGTPTPAWIGVQPLPVERFRFVRLVQLEVRLRHRAPAVFDHQAVVGRETPHRLFAHRDAGTEKLPVIQSRIPQFALQILNPIEQRLGAAEPLVEFFDGLAAGLVQEAQHVIPRFQPDAAGGHGAAAFQ